MYTSESLWYISKGFLKLCNITLLDRTSASSYSYTGLKG